MNTKLAALLVLLACGCAGAAPADAEEPAVAPASAPAPGPASQPQDRPENSPCAGADHRAFDFWVGDWTVRNPAGEVVGHNRIERVHRGCALLEHWQSVRGGKGTSINAWHAAEKVWLQTWVDGTGGVIQLRGGLDGEAMKLSGTLTKPDGTTSLLRGTWTPEPDGVVRQLFEESKDQGASWQVWFDGYYSRQ